MELDGHLRLACYPTLRLDDDGAEDVIARECDGATLAIWDSYRAAAPRTDENSSEARVPLDMLARVSESTGCTQLVIHHARKPNAANAGGAKMSIRGSSALFDACATVLVLDGGEKNGPVVCSQEKARTTGVLRGDFALVIEDEVVDGNPRGGLRVRVGDLEGVADRRANDRFIELCNRVLTFVRANPGSSSRSIRVRVRGKETTILAALEHLERNGAVRNRTAGQSRSEWYPTHTSTPGEAE